MWYLEESLYYCQNCNGEIPVRNFWRGTGRILVGTRREMRTMVLHSLCPICGTRQSLGLDGPWPMRVFHAWLWKIRYPSVRRPAWQPRRPAWSFCDEEDPADLETAGPEYRRAAGE